MRIFRAVSVREPFDCACTGAVFLLKAPNIAVEKKPLSLKGLFDKNAVPASLTAVVFMFTYGALENFCGKICGGKGLAERRLILCDYGSDGADYAYDGGKGDGRHGEGIFAYSCNIAMFAAFCFWGCFRIR